MAKRRRAKLGTGARFRSLTAKLKRRGIRNPSGLAASIGRKKFGKRRFAKLSARGRRRRTTRKK